LLPHEVPLLQEARRIQKAALISNFVDRESERPSLCQSDFLPLPLISSVSETENVNPCSKRKGGLRYIVQTLLLFFLFSFLYFFSFFFTAYTIDFVLMRPLCTEKGQHPRKSRMQLLGKLTIFPVSSFTIVISFLRVFFSLYFVGGFLIFLGETSQNLP
jgi:hypothetical protein